MSETPDRFKTHAQNWTELGNQSPFWAVLSKPGLENADWDPQAFFRDGEQFGRWLSVHLQQLRLELATQRGLDFGCGLGRLTQTLALWFDEVHGVDVAASMIEGARKFNQHGERCIYHHNERLDLNLFENESFDFVLSALVLQHMRPEFMECYIAEFLRLLRPRGLAFFQLPLCPILPTEPAVEEHVPVAEPAGRYEIALRIRPETLAIPAGCVRDVQVVIHNRSARPLPPALRLEARFVHEESGEEVAASSGSVEVTRAVGPDESAVVVMAIRAPSTEGAMSLEVAAVATNPAVTVHAEPGSARTHIAANDASAGEIDPETTFRATAATDGETVIGIMEMFHLPYERVEAIVQENGGRIAHSLEDDWSGPHSVSCHFTVVKE